MSKNTGVNQELRNVIAQGAIALMVCVGAYMFLVDPSSTKLAAARADEAHLVSQASAAEALRNNAPQISAAATRARDEAQKISQTGRLARSEQELFAALSALAARSHIRVDQMTPSKLLGTAKPTAPTATPTPEGSENSLTAAQGYMIDATASYSDIANFIKAVRTELGYCTVKSVRMMPTSDTRTKLVHVVVETEHYSFDASPVSLTADAAGAH